MLVQFNNTQAPLVIFVGDGFYAGGFSRAGVPEEQTVVRFSARHKSIRIVGKLLLGNLVTDQIIQLHMRDIADRLDSRTVLCMYHTERFM